MTLDYSQNDQPVPDWRGYDLNMQPAERKPERTEAEIESAARQEWIDELARLWHAIGKSPTREQMAEYIRALNIVPLGLLSKTITNALRENGSYMVVPTIGAMWTALRSTAGAGSSDDIERAIRKWESTLWEATNGAGY